MRGDCCSRPRRAAARTGRASIDSRPMCGIVGYVGDKQAQDVVIEGLRRLEYRGYDSAGIALVADGAHRLRQAGRQARQPREGHRRAPAAGVDDRHRPHPLGHPRRAERRQRPPAPRARRGRVALVHNGIIENFAELRAELEADGHELLLRDRHRGRRAPARAASWTPGADLTDGDAARLPAARGRVHAGRRRRRRTRRGWWRRAATRRWWSGIGEGENFLGSDVAAFIEHTREALELGQDQVVTITRDGRRRSPTSTARRPRAAATTSTGTCRPPRRTATTGSCARRSTSSRAPWPTRCSGRRTPEGLLHLDEMRLSDQELRDIDKIIIIACGTSFYAGMVAKYAIEHWTRVPVEVELASEFRYRDPILDYSTLVVAISQSGETADTLQAIRHARTQRSKVLAICNTNGSTIPRESDAVIYTHAGPEIGVASTKGFLTQLVACYLLALYLAQVKGTRYGDEIDQVMRPARGDPGADRSGCSTTPSRSTSWRADARRHPVGAVPRPARRLPGRARGRAEAQGARLPPRRGLRRRRAQARPDRADRGRACRCCASCRRRAATSCTTRWSAASRRSGPAAPARSAWPRRATSDRAVRRRADPAAAGAGAAAAAGRRRTRCSCSPASSRPRWATTSTSRATSPSPSRSRVSAVAIIGVGIDVVDIERFGESLERTPGLRRAAVHAGRGDARRWPRWPPGSPPRRRWPRRSAPRRAALARRRGASREDVRPPAARDARHGRGPRRRARRRLACTSRSPTTPASPRPSWSWSR